MRRADEQLKERVKELECLYELSRIALEAGNNLLMLTKNMLSILPPAMQYPKLAEASVTIDGVVAHTRRFSSSSVRITFPISTGNKKRGDVTIGYRPSTSQKVHFLREERKLLSTIARDLSLILQRIDSESEREKLHTQLRQVERLAFVGELSAGIAHELNEPLGRILGFAQLIQKAGGLNDQQEEDMERIVKASLYTREIVKKLMIFSRHMPRQIASVRMNSVIADILYFIDARFASRKITIRQRLDTSLPVIQADEVQMGQILVNLLTNAIHAMPEGGEVVVSTRTKPNGISVSVRDTGHGMTAEVSKKAFEPFFTTKRPGEGTGLGLSVVRDIVNAHNGSIEISSTPGKGTRVNIFLPEKQRTTRKSKS